MSIWIWVIVAVVGILMARSVMMGYRSPAQLASIAEAVRADATLVDVRTPGEFASSHLRQARNVPVEHLPARIGELSKKKTLVVYCHSGARSARAAATLRAAGFKKVFDLGPLRNAAKVGLS